MQKCMCKLLFPRNEHCHSKTSTTNTHTHTVSFNAISIITAWSTQQPEHSTQRRVSAGLSKQHHSSAVEQCCAKQRVLFSIAILYTRAVSVSTLGLMKKHTAAIGEQ